MVLQIAYRVVDYTSPDSHLRFILPVLAPPDSFH